MFDEFHHMVFLAKERHGVLQRYCTKDSNNNKDDVLSCIVFFLLNITKITSQPFLI